MEFFSRIYEWNLKKNIQRLDVPCHIVLALSENDLFADENYHKLNSFVSWCKEMNMKNVTVYVNILEVDSHINYKICNKLSQEIPDMLKNITPNINMIKKGDKEIKKYPTDEMVLDISLGYSGKYEMTRVIKQIMSRVKEGKLSPDDIDEDAIESHLLFKSEPDIVIRAGGKRLTDFLIWQSV